MRPVREAYWLTETWRKAHLRYWPFYGRGLVQLTWEDNYRKMTAALRKLDIEVPDLVKEPDAALRSEYAVPIMFEGMLRAETALGDFTGRCLEQYFGDNIDRPLEARAIINGTDKAQLIAGYHFDFLDALQSAAIDRGVA